MEAEVAAADVAARTLGLPHLDLWMSLAKSSNLWEKLLDRRVKLTLI